MKCPVCKQNTLEAAELVPQLAGFVCRQCAGVWIARRSYDAWREQQPALLPDETAPAQAPAPDTHPARLCPECGHLLLPYRVGHGLACSIDHCGACNGVWLDRPEWDAIQARRLHASLHEMVSARWQAEVRQAGLEESIEQTYARRLGPAYAQAREFKTWLRAQPQRGLILSYLAESKPDGR